MNNKRHVAKKLKWKEECFANRRTMAHNCNNSWTNGAKYIGTYVIAMFGNKPYVISFIIKLCLILLNSLVSLDVARLWEPNIQVTSMDTWSYFEFNDSIYFARI
jgi:hypothetical protein